MADGLLSSALGGLVIRPQETTFGRLSTGLSGAGNLISPYASTGQALAIGLGSLLMQGLSQYQAEKTAQEETREALQGFTKLQAAQTPEEQLAVIDSISSPRARQRLGSLATALQGTKLATQMEVQSEIDKVVGKEKGLAEFYATPVGEERLQQQLEQLRAQSEARRTPLSERLALEDVRQKNRRELRELADDAAMGREESRQAFLFRKQAIDQAFKTTLAEYQSKLGVEAATKKAEELNNLRNRLIAEGNLSDLAEAEAKADIQRTMQEHLIGVREESQARLKEKETTEQGRRQQFTATIKQEFPQIPAALTTQTSKQLANTDTAIDIAKDVERYANYVTYKVGTKLSATDEENLRARLQRLVTAEVLAWSGTAARKDEKQDIQRMLEGDFTANPTKVAELLRRYAQDQRTAAKAALSAAGTPKGKLIEAIDQAIQTGDYVKYGQFPQLGAGQLQMGPAAQSSDPEIQALMDELNQLDQLIQQKQQGR